MTGAPFHRDPERWVLFSNGGQTEMGEGVNTPYKIHMKNIMLLHQLPDKLPDRGSGICPKVNLIGNLNFYFSWTLLVLASFQE